jgi:hypothetical protein
MYTPYEKTQRDLHQDDIDAITDKYQLVPTGSSPVVTISSPANDEEFNSGELIGFTGSASDADEGDLTSSIVWTSNIDGEIGTGLFSKVLSDDTHTITASVTDSDGNTDTASVTIVVGTPIQTGTVSVTSFEWSDEGGKDGKKHLLSTVNLDGSATINIKLTNTDGGKWTGSGTTGSDGSITFTFKNAPKSEYTIEVTAIDDKPAYVTSTPPYSNS